MQKTNFREQFKNVADACALAQSIVDTVREPVIVLDKGLRVIAASRSFYSAFAVSPEETQRKTPLRVRRRAMGYSETSLAARENYPGTWRDNGL